MSKVMDQYMEQYYFYRLCSIDFDMTKHFIRILKRYRRKDVRNCLLRSIVVSYCRPFSENRGEKISTHKLNKKVVPKDLRPLHDELVWLRNQLFAHTDYIYRQPKVGYLNTGSRELFPMSFRNYDYNKLNKRISEIEKLVVAVEKKLQGKIDKIQRNLPMGK